MQGLDKTLAAGALNIMKKIICFAVVLVAGAVLLIGAGSPANSGSAAFEYAIVKWDGPDRLFYNLPGKFEWVHLEKTGVTIPREAQEEEFCLTAAANQMAKDGWEPIEFDSRRILFRHL